MDKIRADQGQAIVRLRIPARHFLEYPTDTCYVVQRHAPIYLWYTLTRKGYHGMRKDVEKCLRNAHILKVLKFVAILTHSQPQTPSS